MAIVLDPSVLKPAHRRKTQKCNGLRYLQYSSTMILLKRLRFETSTSYGPSAITPVSLGGQGKDLIVGADLVLRIEMFRINTMHPALTGDEVTASVLTSACCCDPAVATHYRASHLPTSRQAFVENRREMAPAVRKVLPHRRHRVELTPRVKYAGCSLPGAVCGEMVASEFKIPVRETPRRVCKVEWAMNVVDADELRPDGRNPCNGDEAIAIATSPYINGVGHLTLTTATTSTQGRKIGLRCPNNPLVISLSSTRTQPTHIA